MRNLLQEFLTEDGIRQPSILGVREHIFTGRLITNVLHNWDFIFCYFCILNLSSPMLQCLLPCMVYVKSGAQFCDYWTTAACKPSEVRSSPVNYFTAHLLTFQWSEKYCVYLFLQCVNYCKKRRKKHTVYLFEYRSIWRSINAVHLFSPLFFRNIWRGK